MSKLQNRWPITKKYKIKEDGLSSVVNEPEVEFVKFFSSQEEAELYNIKKSLQKTDMERLHTLCRLIRIGKMLSGAQTAGAILKGLSQN